MKPFLFWIIIGLMTLLALLIVLIPLRRNDLKSVKLTVIFILLGLPISAFILYFNFGSSQKLAQYWKLKNEVAVANTELKKIKNPQQVIEKLQRYLKANPGHARGWYLLGKLNFGLHHYRRANFELKKAHQLKPTNTDYAVAYAEASFFVNKQKLSPSVLSLLDMIIQHQPKNVSAINLVAINAYMQKKYILAIRYWRRLLPLFSAGSQDRRILLKMISRAQKSKNEL